MELVLQLHTVQQYGTCNHNQDNDNNVWLHQVLDVQYK